MQANFIRCWNVSSKVKLQLAEYQFYLLILQYVLPLHFGKKTRHIVTVIADSNSCPKSRRGQAQN